MTTGFNKTRAIIAPATPIPTAYCTQGLFTLLGTKRHYRTAAVTPSQLVPHAHMTLRHYASVWKKRKELLGRPVPPSDWRFLQEAVLPLLEGVTIQELFQNAQLLPALFCTLRTTCGEAPAKRSYRLVNQIVRSLMADQLMPTNVCSGSLPLVRTGFSMRTLTPVQRTAIVRESIKDAKLAPVGLVLETGLALEEVVMLTHVDLNLSTAQLHVNSPPSSRRFSRTIPLSRDAVAILRSVCDKCGAPQASAAPLFPGRDGKPCSVATLRSRIATMRRLTSIAHLSHRTLVYDFAAYAIRRHIDPIQLKDYLGYQNPGTILNLWETIPRADQRRTLWTIPLISQ